MQLLLLATSLPLGALLDVLDSDALESHLSDDDVVSWKG